ncbi:Nuclear transport factor 2 [Tulasnella sp. 424]|nr:Nuclear transport factor 2 [Tulasnella sp. 424]KAG8967649.1 Nuclear transport factor 2 [Tulasnella sp. 425]
MTTPQDIGTQFVQYYYATFDGNRPGLAPLYVRQTFGGTTNIVEKITSLPFQSVKHQVTTLDAQAASPTTIIVMVTGALVIDDSPPMQFSQCFHLVQDGSSFYVYVGGLVALQWPLLIYFPILQA